ncbi:uncharacterized protein IUM83_17810, partial [Phytophthora cinnamomi]|uniref:uncharacterized protein n=1 Tax=Phytophthora cinnamomi TaxID=4785 RepID=UPI00355A426E
MSTPAKLMNCTKSSECILSAVSFVIAVPVHWNPSYMVATKRYSFLTAGLAFSRTAIECAPLKPPTKQPVVARKIRGDLLELAFS